MGQTSLFSPMEYPIYAAQEDGAVFYCIWSSERFEEYKRLGSGESSRYMHTEVDAQDYFMRLYIQDLLSNIDEGKLKSITAAEYASLANKKL